MDVPHRIFLLSPAHCGGKRAGYAMNPAAQFELARRLRLPEGAPLGDVFSFLSGLYFRAKLAYAREFANPPAGAPGALVITSNRGLLTPETAVTVEALRAFGDVSIDADDPQYRLPLERDARSLGERIGHACQVVLLGSVATRKYVDVLGEVFGPRLRFPGEFAGRGDMSRGGLMLRQIDRRCELCYVAIAGSVRHGKRPAKLERREGTGAKRPVELHRARTAGRDTRRGRQKSR